MKSNIQRLKTGPYCDCNPTTGLTLIWARNPFKGHVELPTSLAGRGRVDYTPKGRSNSDRSMQRERERERKVEMRSNRAESGACPPRLQNIMRMVLVGLLILIFS